MNVGNLYDPNSAAYNAALSTPPTILDVNNNINYLTGVFIVNFPLNTIPGSQINSQTVPVNTGLPHSIMYFSNTFYSSSCP